jgi:hypothetical protein
MRARAALTLTLLCFLGGSCAAPRAGAPESEPFRPSGEILFFDASAAFDANRVIGPHVNVSRRSDGSWAGTIEQDVVDINVTADRLTGANLKASIQHNKRGLVISGQWRDLILYYQIGSDQVLIRSPNYSLSLLSSEPGIYGPYRQLKLIGEAAKADPPMPQFVLALVAIFH